MREDKPVSYTKLAPADRKRTINQTIRQTRRSWGLLIDTIAAGQVVFVPGIERDLYALAYLRLALKRRGRGEKLRTRVAARDGVAGRELWVE